MCGGVFAHNKVFYDALNDPFANCGRNTHAGIGDRRKSALQSAMKEEERKGKFNPLVWWLSRAGALLGNAFMSFSFFYKINAETWIIE